MKRKLLTTLLVLCSIVGVMGFAACGDSNNDDNVHNLANHQHYPERFEDSMGEWSVVEQATCLKKGTKQRSCSECEYSEEQSFEGEHAYGEWEIKWTATCTREGEQQRVCDECGGTDRQTVPMLKHNEVVDKAVSPTCTESGLTEGRHCSECSTVFVAQESVYALGHEEIHHEGKEATCTVDGWDAYETCLRCDYSSYQAIPASHRPIIDDFVSPTCTETGLTEGSHCSECDEVLVAQQSVAALGHDEVPHEGKTPTCTQLGWAAYETCSRCDYTTYKGVYAEHDYDKTDICTVCTHEKGATAGLSFTLAADGNSYSVANIGNATDTDIVIPSTYQRKPVNAIAERAFRYNSKITSVVIPDSVTTIGEEAFNSCEALTSITVGKGVATIGSSAFAYCAKLTELNFNATAMLDLASENLVFATTGEGGDGITVNVGANVTKIPAYMFFPNKYSNPYAPKIMSVVFAENSECESIGERAFSYCESLASIAIPESVTAIGDSAFVCCESLSSVTLPNNLTQIGKSVFSNCTMLTSITIHETVTTIGHSAFYGCSALEEINFNATAVSDLTWSGGVFQDAGTSEKGITVNVGANVTKIPAYLFYQCNIVHVAFAENSACESIGDSAFESCEKLVDVQLSNGITSIGNKAFYYCSSLKSAKLPNDLITIGDYAFYFTALKSVTISEGVTSIGSSSFYGCSDLTEIHYNATSESLKCYFTGAGENADSLVVSIGANVTKISDGLFSNSYVSSLMFAQDSKCATIGENAFAWCAKLTNITIPESVTTIGKNAFAWCTVLTEIHYNATAITDFVNGSVFTDSGTSTARITVGANVTKIPANLFAGISAISVIFAENGVCESIGEMAFYNASLRNVVIPDSVTTIGKAAFQNCDSMTSLTVGANVTSLGEYAFACAGLTEVNYNATAMPDLLNNNHVFSSAGTGGDGITVRVGANVTKIPKYLFYNSDSSSTEPKIKSVVFAENGVCESIGAYAFYSIESLTNVTLTDSIVTIGVGAFNYCIGLTVVTIPKNVTTMERAFDDCTNLTEIYFNATAMQDFEDTPFSGCTEAGITVHIGANVTRIPAYLFNSGNGNMNKRTLNIANVVFTENSVCESIGESAFFQCTELTSIVLPKSVTSIGRHAFNMCTGLTSIDISSVTSIGQAAFSNCVALESITIGGDVTQLVDVFAYCTALTSINFNGTIAQWNSIEKGGDWNINTGAYTIFCTDGRISKTGDITYN